MNENLEKTKQLLQNHNYDFSVKDNKVKIYCDTELERPVFLEKVKFFFNSYTDFIYNPDPNKGSSCGRLEKFDKQKGNVFVFVKPKNGCNGQAAAETGIKYENIIYNKITSLLSDTNHKIKRGGGGSLADFTIDDRLKLEIKSSRKADFGQFTIQYNKFSKKWFINKTQKYLKNKYFYNSLFEKYIQDFVSTNAIFTEEIYSFEELNYKNKNVISGIKYGLHTDKLKQIIENTWFAGQESKYFDVDIIDVQNYYLNRDDDYIQIRDRGLFALKENKLNIPLLYDKCHKDAKLRFRIKPHAKGGRHSFVISTRIGIDASPFSLENEEILKKLLQELD